MRILRRILAAGALLAAYAGPAEAFTMSATPAEVAALPAYCTARLSEIGSFSVQGMELRPGPGEIERWKAELGTSYVYVHHMCGGMILIQRGRLSVDRVQRARDLDRALYETNWTYERVPVSDPFFAVAATQMGLVHRARKEYRQALEYFQLAIDKYPRYASSYQGGALALEEQGKLDDAKAILEKGLQGTEGQSADIHYSLGLLNLKLKQLDDAEHHARRAYELGYPLPGLRNKLAAAGRPIS